METRLRFPPTTSVQEYPGRIQTDRASLGNILPSSSLRSICQEGSESLGVPQGPRAAERAVEDGLVPAPINLFCVRNPFGMHMTTGCTALSLILRNFAHIIKTNVKAPIQTVGVDISREERYNKCLKCYKSLQSIRTFLLKRQTMQGKLGQSFRELLLLMEGLEN
ncbi:hypothetical protein RUM43_009370 [Polyplax serrata]|uniref:Katanin p80 subunit C-terminal domain-containing protein n=1 Tax=Polyplax serrata TaxID=468196 RepID=A0AAN8PAP9_POLSC